MADEGKKGTYSSTLADRKSKRLESALSSYSSEETKKAVGRLLEAYMDEGGKNYFGAGRRDTTLYFADDDYIKEVDKVKPRRSAAARNNEEKDVHNPIPDNAEFAETSEEQTTEPKQTKDKEKAVTSIDPTIVIDPERIRSAEKLAEDNAKEGSDINESTEEETPEMKHNDEFEEEVVPRRRRSAGRKPEPEPEIEENEDEIEYEDDEYDDDEYDDEEYEEYEYDDDEYDDDEEYEEKKGGLFSVFKKNKHSYDDEDDEEYEDLEEYDEEYDDEEYDDEYDDDDYDESAVSVRKIFHIIFVVLLICAVAALAAMCYSYKNNYDSARQQIEQLQGEGGTSTAEQINELKAQVEQLKAENAQLKNGRTGGNNTEGSGSGAAGEGSAANASADAQAAGGIQTADGAPSSVVDDTSGATSSNSGGTYTVQAGDNTGVKLCTNVYGQYTPELWNKLCQANGKSGSDFVVGEEIIVP